jgi:hypothetical protein
MAETWNGGAAPLMPSGAMDTFLGAVLRPLYRGSIPEWQSKPLRALVVEGQSRGACLGEIAYVLATAHHETGRFRYMEEIASGAAYEGRKDLGNTKAGDGKRFKGRGFVQLTGRANYQRTGDRLGVDLIETPDLACDPEIAAKIIWDGMIFGTFTGRRLTDYIAPGHADFFGARAIVNGTDRADLIAGYAGVFMSALRSSGLFAQRPDAKEAATSIIKSPVKASITTGAAVSAIGVVATTLKDFVGVEGPLAWGIGIGVALAAVCGAVWFIKGQMGRGAA